MLNSLPEILDNMIWNSLTTGNRDMAVINEDVGHYRPDIAPFAAMKERTLENLEKLYDMVLPDKTIALSWLEPYAYDPAKWKLLHRLECTQMVYERPVSNFKTRNSHLIVPLTDEHIPQMLELTALTKPGPFLQRTIEFGHYFGIFIDGRLAAMAGQRMHPLPYMEVSAVCTHPDFRGHGYAKTLMLHVMEIIVGNSFVPFLHVLTSNTSAIGLYGSIGYNKRIEILIDVVRKNGE